MNLRQFLILTVVSTSCVSAYAQDAKKTAEDFATKWVTAYDAGDATVLAALFTQDGVFNAPSGAVLKGRDAIEKALAGRIKAGWTKETVTTTDAGAAGSAVWAAGATQRQSLPGGDGIGGPRVHAPGNHQSICPELNFLILGLEPRYDNETHGRS